MAKSQVNHISAKDAYDLIQKEPSAAFIDVRSDMEYLFIGHPKGAVNIPWIDEPDFVINPNFERPSTSTRWTGPPGKTPAGATPPAG